MTYCTDDDFAVWAFGKDLWRDFIEWSAFPWELMSSWNHRHGYKLCLHPDDSILESMDKMKRLWNKENNLTPLKDPMDKKMAKVTKTIKTAERDIKSGRKQPALKALKGAAKKNVKLTKEDRDVRDPEIEAFKKMKKKGC